LPDVENRIGQLWAVDDAAFLPLIEEMRAVGLTVDVVQTGTTYR
jgi:hypothetical protein